MLTSLLGLFASPALACGGFFCTPAITPIDQAAEEILYVLDSGNVEMHVEITYEGKSDDFAWILPVPAEPELFLSSDEIFMALGLATAPIFQTNNILEGRCKGSRQLNLGCSNEVSLGSRSDGAIPPYNGTVTVIGEEQIGPFETVTLQAQSSDGLLDWLNANNYDLPADLDPLLAPYIAGGSYFVAMRLSADKDAGDIEPIGLRYPGDEMAIPIQLTAVAAAEDMALRVYVLGDSRAVPLSYLHVEVNEAAIDWIANGANYFDVVAAAVDEAGGQAFVTDFSGDSSAAQGFSTELDQLLPGNPVLTRLSTAISPHEMTVDPTFGFNPSLPEVPRTRTADLISDCENGRPFEQALVTVVLEDGRVLEHGEFPVQTAQDSEPTVRDLQGVPALVVADLSSGKGEVIADFSDEADAAIEAHNDRRVGSGCGCSTAPGAGTMAVGGLLLLALGRRRR